MKALCLRATMVPCGTPHAAFISEFQENVHLRHKQEHDASLENTLQLPWHFSTEHFEPLKQTQLAKQIWKTKLFAILFSEMFHKGGQMGPLKILDTKTRN